MRIMSLCDLCSTIPFDALKPLPVPDGPQNSAHKLRFASRVLYFHRNRFDNDTYVGFPWHQDLSTLSLSKSCPLCILVQEGAKSWLDSYDEAATSTYDPAKLLMPR